MPAGWSVPQLTPSSGRKGGGGSYWTGEWGGEICNVGRCWYVVLCWQWRWWRGWPAAATSPQARLPAGRWGGCAGHKASSSGDRRPGTEAGSGWAAHLEDGDGERRMPPTPTSTPQLAWWHTARYTQISATLGQISQNVSLQRRDDLKTPNSYRLCSSFRLNAPPYKLLIFDSGRSSALSLQSNPDEKSRWVRA